MSAESPAPSPQPGGDEDEGDGSPSAQGHDAAAPAGDGPRASELTDEERRRFEAFRRAVFTQRCPGRC